MAKHFTELKYQTLSQPVFFRSIQNGLWFFDKMASWQKGKLMKRPSTNLCKECRFQLTLTHYDARHILRQYLNFRVAGKGVYVYSR
jgi:hypothetical protein